MVVVLHFHQLPGRSPSLSQLLYSSGVCTVSASICDDSGQGPGSGPGQESTFSKTLSPSSQSVPIWIPASGKYQLGAGRSMCTAHSTIPYVLKYSAVDASGVQDGEVDDRG